MQITSHVEELQRRLIAAAAPGTPEAQEIAGRLIDALDASVRLTVLEALADAAGEITRELAPGSVDVRLRGREIDFVVAKPDGDDVAAASPVPARATADAADDAASTRTTLRISDSLKARAEEAAAAEGLSLNTWLVRAVSAALEPRTAVTTTSDSGYTGWVR